MTKKQKKFYLTPEASYFLDRLRDHYGGTNSNTIERLITEEAAKRGIPALPAPNSKPNPPG